MPFKKDSTINKGRKHSLEHTKKIALANTGKKRSLEQRQRISDAHKGLKHTEIQKQRISLALKAGGHRPITKYGSEHANWVGDKVGYAGVHNWIERQRGKARFLPCVMAFDGTCKGPCQWSNISREYHRDVLDFQVLCASHHTRYDRLCKNKHLYI